MPASTAWGVLLAFCLSGALLAGAAAVSKKVVVVFSTNGTDTTVVQDVLSAADIQMASISQAGSSPHRHVEHLIETIKQVQNTTVHEALAVGYCLQGTLKQLQVLVKAHPSIHVIHFVRDIRPVMQEQLTSSNFAETGSTANSTGSGRAALTWAAENAAIKKWATTHGLGLARRYSIARLEDLCSPAQRKRAVASLLHNAGLVQPVAQPAGATAVAAVKEQYCPANTWKGKDVSAAERSLEAIDSSIRHTLLAFGYEPATGLGLPDWLQAQSALSQVDKTAALMASDGTPAVVTFVSNGYEPILNNWLAWVKKSGADVTRVVVVTPPEAFASVRQKLLYRDVHVVAIGTIEPTDIAPGTSHALAAADATRHARARVWLQRIRVLYSFIDAGVPVVMSDLDAIWMHDAVADLLSMPARKGRGYDLMLSPGYFPFDVHKQMGVVGCMGFLYANATSATRRLLGVMLREKLHQMDLHEVKYYNDQRVLNEQLVQANVAINISTIRHTRRQVHGTPQPVLAEQLTTAPDALRVLFLSDQRYARACSNSTAYADAVVVHCQSFNSGAAKRTFLHKVGLWNTGHDQQHVHV